MQNNSKTMQPAMMGNRGRRGPGGLGGFSGKNKTCWVCTNRTQEENI